MLNCRHKINRVCIVYRVFGIVYVLKYTIHDVFVYRVPNSGWDVGFYRAIGLETLLENDAARFGAHAQYPGDTLGTGVSSAARATRRRDRRRTERPRGVQWVRAWRLTAALACARCGRRPGVPRGRECGARFPRRSSVACMFTCMQCMYCTCCLVYNVYYTAVTQQMCRSELLSRWIVMSFEAIPTEYGPMLSSMSTVFTTSIRVCYLSNHYAVGMGLGHSIVQ